MPLAKPRPAADESEVEDASTSTRAPANVGVSLPALSKSQWFLAVLPLVYLWARLIDNLRLQWSTDPHYAYGWVVPLLCLGLVLRRWDQPGKVENSRPNSECRQFFLSQFTVQFFFVFLAFLYLPTRLVEAAIPEWRPIGWLLGVEVIGLTLCGIELGKGRGWLRQLAFPILFFLVAIPWPTPLETPLIQSLTRVSASFVAEALGWLGVPAMVHGNVLEVATGMVGIDEACSGIRSFQSSIMISLFLGEFYRLRLNPRLLLLLLGFGFSMAFNLCRMTFLTLIAARKGVGAISIYHDPAGLTIAIACTLVLWGIAKWLKTTGENRTQTAENPLQASHSPLASRLGPPPSAHAPLSTLPFLSCALIGWLICAESGIALWYHHLESGFVPGPDWTVRLPTGDPTFKELPIAPATRSLLRFDEGKQGAWEDEEGGRWQAYYFDWRPGRVAGYLAKRHTPEICLAATGCRLQSGPNLNTVSVNGVALPIRSYVFMAGGQLLHVYHCRWEAGARTESYVEHESARYNLLRAICAGRGNRGQKVLEIIVSGIDDPTQLNTALTRELRRLVQVTRPDPKA